ncbi:hypothetical protein HK100_007160 [Physocladia obscura]|uniref:HMG box domain-containing protein n=1 Tax=Physocladia obscura TaxID=109957 RepID=A0AAD5XBB0_9FUNG|nr:hypothetical protein HK100_007160 [Physocladia obscura]
MAQYQITLVSGIDGRTVEIPHGTTEIGRGWNGVTDAHLSRKQLVLHVDAARGTVEVTRLGPNVSRVIRQSAVSESEVLAKDAKTLLAHGDSLLLVGAKLPFKVSIVPIAKEKEKNEEKDNDLDTLAQIGFNIASASNSPAASLAINKRHYSTSFSTSSNLSPGLRFSHSPNSAAQFPRQEQDEQRWTDDEDDDNDSGKSTRANFTLRKQLSSTKVSSNASGKRPLLRADFSDESDDLMAFDSIYPRIHTVARDSDGDSDVKSDADSIVPIKRTTSSMNRGTASTKKIKKTPAKPPKKTVTRRSQKKVSKDDNSISSPSSTDNNSTNENNHESSESPSAKKRESRQSSKSVTSAAERKKLVESRRIKQIRQRQLNLASSSDAIRNGSDSEDYSETTSETKKATITTRRKTTFAHRRRRRRSVSAYGIFVRLERRNIKAQNPTLSSAEITALVKSTFNLLQDDDRDQFHRLAVEENNRNNDNNSEKEDDENDDNDAEGETNGGIKTINDDESKSSASIQSARVSLRQRQHSVKVESDQENETSESEEIVHIQNRKSVGSKVTVATVPLKQNIKKIKEEVEGKAEESGSESSALL